MQQDLLYTINDMGRHAGSFQTLNKPAIFSNVKLFVQTSLAWLGQHFRAYYTIPVLIPMTQKKALLLILCMRSTACMTCTNLITLCQLFQPKQHLLGSCKVSGKTSLHQ